MAFRKRNVGLSSGGQEPKSPAPSLPGVRPSPLDGRPTTSTGTPTLDQLLAGHAGLALGSSLLIEESGTTDFAGALLRYYAAEGIVQGHQVHVVGVGETWGRDLPGLTGAVDAGNGESRKKSDATEKMKIAWRYERLGEFGAGVAGSRAVKDSSTSSAESTTSMPSFCHTFDLTKRLTHPGISTVDFIPLRVRGDGSPFTSIVEHLSSRLASSAPTTVHRLVLPSLLSPALYPPHTNLPQHVLQFMHALRALLEVHANRFTVMMTIPLSLYPRTSGLVRWIEILSSGVIELAPFPHDSHVGAASIASSSGAATSQEEPPQGMLKVHKLPVFHERGGGGSTTVGEDWAFTLSRRRFAIKPFSLPPVEGDNEAQQGDANGGKPKKADMEF